MIRVISDKETIVTRCLNCNTRLGLAETDIQDRIDENYELETYIVCPKCGEDVRLN